MIRWADKQMLWGLVLLVPFWFLTRFLLRRRKRRLAKMADEALWPVLLPGFSLRRLLFRNTLRILALAAAVLALARPQWGFRWEEVKRRSLNIIVALDTSKSMLAQDIKPNRLQQAKWGIRDLVRQLKGDRIGLVVFAGDAYLFCPPTIDYAAFLLSLDDVYAGIVPVGGTDIAGALRTAMESFDKMKEKAGDKVILLISDGESTTGDPLALVPELKKRGIRVFTIGVGTRQGDLIQTPEGFVKDAQGNVVKSSLHEDVLERLALATGGFYVRSAPGDFGIERIYRQGLAPLQRAEGKSRMAKIWTERFPWFVGAALLLLAAEALLAPVRGNGRRRKAKKKAAALLPLLLLFCLPHTASAERSPRAAIRAGVKAYHKGDYTNAVAAFNEASGAFPALAAFNRGDALYRAGRFEEAAKAFTEALRTTDTNLQADAYYNLGNALLARTTTLSSGTNDLHRAVELAFQAENAYRKALLLRPGDEAARRNFERAYNLRVKLEFNIGKRLYDEAEALLKQYKARAAKEKYLAARKQFQHILRDLAPRHQAARHYLENIADRLEMLRKAVEETRKQLRYAIREIKDYQYLAAADRLKADSPARRYAFDLEPDLKKRFAELLQRDQNVIKIIEKYDKRNLAK